MPVIKNKALIRELFDLLREIRDDAEFGADIASNFEDEEDFHDMIDWLQENRGHVTYKDAVIHSVLIWQRNQPDDIFEDEDEEHEELSPAEKEILHAICDACDYKKMVRISLRDGTVYTQALVTDISFANDEEEFVIRTKDRDTDSFLEHTLKFDDVQQVCVYYGRTNEPVLWRKE